jgi:hypothetical protein
MAFCYRSLAVGYLLVGFGGSGVADDPPVSAWQRLFQQQADEYRIQFVDRDASVQLRAEPILKWSQPVRGGGEGAVYLWTEHGRPVTIATFFIWPADNNRHGVAHEFHSLVTEPLTARWRDRTWSPPKNGVAWQHEDDLPTPAASSEQRLRQMRDLARQFQATSRDRQDKTWELRLLTRPLYRYDLPNGTGTPPVGSLLDGGLFGFVEGTDLEIVLLLQAVQTENGPRWEYAFARMSDYRLAVRRNDRTVWDVEPHGPDTPNAAYHCTTVEYRTSAE